MSSQSWYTILLVSINSKSRQAFYPFHIVTRVKLYITNWLKVQPCVHLKSTLLTWRMWCKGDITIMFSFLDGYLPLWIINSIYIYIYIQGFEACLLMSYRQGPRQKNFKIKQSYWSRANIEPINFTSCPNPKYEVNNKVLFI